MKDFVFYRNTKYRCNSEQEAEVMDSCEEQREAIDYDEFIQHIKPEDFAEIAESLGYDDELKPEDDWSLAYFKSSYGGVPCFVFSCTECDFIFLKRDDAKMLLERYASGDDPDWGRKTQFGKGTVDRQDGFFEN